MGVRWRGQRAEERGMRDVWILCGIVFRTGLFGL